MNRNMHKNIMVLMSLMCISQVYAGDNQELNDGVQVSVQEDDKQPELKPAHQVRYDMPLLLEPDIYHKIIELLPDDFQKQGLSKGDLKKKPHLQNEAISAIKKDRNTIEETFYYTKNKITGLYTLLPVVGIIGVLAKLKEASIVRSLVLSLGLGATAVGVTKLISAHTAQKESLPSGSKLLAAMNFLFGGILVACAHSPNISRAHGVILGCFASSVALSGLGFNELYAMHIKTKELAMNKAKEDLVAAALSCDDNDADQAMLHAQNAFAKTF